MASHGEVLTMLLRSEKSETFAFLDSDIFATGPFLADLAAIASESDAIFGCEPPWTNEPLRTLPQGHEVLFGYHRWLWNGLYTGLSFFAVYDRRLLNRIVSDTKITFRNYIWAEIPTPAQKRLESHDLRLGSYDTGKVVNILMEIDGHRLSHFDATNLGHLGGLSQAVRTPTWRRFARRLVGGRGLVDLAPERLMRRMPRQTKGHLVALASASPIERDRHRDQLERRRAVSDHFQLVLDQLSTSGHAATPTFLHDDSELEQRVASIQTSLASEIGAQPRRPPQRVWRA